MSDLDIEEQKFWMLDDAVDTASRSPNCQEGSTERQDERDKNKQQRGFDKSNFQPISEDIEASAERQDDEDGAEDGQDEGDGVWYNKLKRHKWCKFSMLFSSEDTWKEEIITQHLKELNPDIKAIFEAAWAGNVHQLQKILKEAHVLDRLKDSEVTGYRDGEGRTPLHLASVCGHVDCVKLLIQNGAPVNATDGKDARTTPLICAASCGSVPVVKALLAGGANVNAGLEHGKTALHWAVQAGSVKCAKVLLEANAKVNPSQVFIETPLHVAASQGDSECLQLLLNYKADVNLCKGTQRSTALNLSCEKGNVACVRLLLEAGAANAAKDVQGHTALHVAAKCEDVDCVTVLLECKADPNVVDGNGRTPLHYAVGKGSRAAECVGLLIKNGADVNAQDKYGFTPLHFSAVNESSQCAAILLHHGGDVTLKNKLGVNALSSLVRKIPCVMRHLKERLNSAVTIEDYDPTAPECKVRLNFRAIIPNCEQRYENVNGNKKNNENGWTGENDNGKQQSDGFSRKHKETEFLYCLMTEGNKKILAHPLSEAFLTLKWRRVRKFFLASLLFEIALVVLFTIYVLEVYRIRCPYRRMPSSDHSKGCLKDYDITIDSQINSEGLQGTVWPLKLFGFMPPDPKTTTNPNKKVKTFESPDNISTPYLLSQAPPYNLGNQSLIVNNTVGRFPSGTPENKVIQTTCCEFDPVLKTIWIVLINLAGIMAVKEILQLLQSPLCYVHSWENWGQWLLISSVIVTLAPWKSHDSHPENWEYPVVACGVFLAWGLLLMQIGRFPALGVYVQMLRKVAANFGYFILGYSCLIFAFVFAFCVLFPEQPPYSTVSLSILKILTMMVGEVNYEDFFYNEDRQNDHILLPITAHLLYAAFIVFVTIILMNLLVGLAVHDIQGLQKGAKLDRLCRQTKLISRLESFIFSKKLESVLPHSIKSFLQKSALVVPLVPPTSYNWYYDFRPNDPRDNCLPKEIKKAALRLAANRHSCAKSKKNVDVTSTNTKRSSVVRPLSTFSHHAASKGMPVHQENALRRLGTQLDHIQTRFTQLGEALHTINRRIDHLVVAMGNPPSAPAHRYSHRRFPRSFNTINNFSISPTSPSDNGNEDSVFTEDDCPDGMYVTESLSLSPCSSLLNRRVKPPKFSEAPEVLKDNNC